MAEEGVLEGRGKGGVVGRGSPIEGAIVSVAVSPVLPGRLHRRHSVHIVPEGTQRAHVNGELIRLQKRPGCAWTRVPRSKRGRSSFLVQRMGMARVSFPDERKREVGSREGRGKQRASETEGGGEGEGQRERERDIHAQDYRVVFSNG